MIGFGSIISDFQKQSSLDTANSLIDTIAPSGTWTSTGTDLSNFDGAYFSFYTTQDCTIYAEFSPNNINWHSTITYTVVGGQNQPHILKRTKRYFRLRLVNGSVQNDVFIQCFKGGGGGILTSPLNSTVLSNSDTILVRPLDFNLMVASGLYQDRIPVLKEGVTPTLSQGTGLTQDICSNGSAYTGFPSVAAAAEIVVAGADTGTVTYNYMATDTDLDYTTGVLNITGAGTYPLPHNVWRSNFAFFNNGSTFNVSAITMRHTATPANVFWTIPTGNIGQTECAAYTVPYNSTMYFDRNTGNCRGNASGSIDGAIYWKEYGKSPRLRFNFELQFGGIYFDDIDYLVPIPARTDLIPRIIAVSNNNMVGKYTMRFIKVKN